MIKILSIDGGGVRGIIPATILKNFEDILKKETNNDKAVISDYFDLISGTSTGGILTLLYLTPNKDKKAKYSANDALNLYLSHSQKIFKESKINNLITLNGIFGAKYTSKNLKELSGKYFEDVRLRDLLKPSLITAYDLNRNIPVFFSKCKTGYGECEDFFIKDIAVATSSAPTYFNLAKVKSILGKEYSFVDGGVYANNPTLCGLIESLEIYKEKLENIKILSIGTGNKDQKNYNINGMQGLVFWANDIISVMMNGIEETTHNQLEQIFKSIECKNNYLRINVEEKLLDRPLPSLDSCSSEDLAYLNQIGEDLSTLYKKDIINFIKQN